MKSVFEDLKPEAYPYHFAGTLHVSVIAAGIPANEKVAEAWLRTKLVGNKDDLIREEVAQTMIALGVTSDEAAEKVAETKSLNKFKRDENGLYIEGRQLKAALKEAASVAVAADKLDARGWGKTNKGLQNYLAEHVFVVEDRLYLGVEEPTGINQRFVHTFRGTGIQYEEFVMDAMINFTVISDHPFTETHWGHIWLCGEQQGIGASRSQGYGRYEVIKWDPIPVLPSGTLRTPRAKASATARVKTATSEARAAAAADRLVYRPAAGESR
jgi:hypothetical protein